MCRRRDKINDFLRKTIIQVISRYYDMSHTDRNTFGLEHGKIGDRIAVVLDGKQIYKKLYKPTNPRTIKQQMHRAKIAFINRLSSVLAEAVNLGFEMVPEKGSGQSPRNAFVKMNWNNGSIVWTEREQCRANGQTIDEREQCRANGQTIDERKQCRANGQREEGDAEVHEQRKDASNDVLTGEWGIAPQRLVKSLKLIDSNPLVKPDFGKMKVKY